MLQEKNEDVFFLIQNVQTYPECPDGPIEPKEQKKRAAEIQRKKAALNKIINKHKKRKR
jgi:hypothetical protein